MSRVLSCHNISKSFGSTAALHDVSLDIAPGCVTALIGENGAGKSTLMRILAGMIAPDHGEIRWDAQSVIWRDPSEARRAGVVLAHQELSLIGSLTVADNLFLASSPSWALGPRQLAHEQKEAQRVLARWAPGLLATDLVESLSLADQYRVEIARILAQEPSVVLFDEPTAAFSHEQVETFLEQLRALKRAGVAIVFTSHRLHEIYAVADRIAVMKDGALVAFEDAAALGRDDAVRRMVGRPLGQLFPSRSSEVADQPVLTVKDLADERFGPISLKVHPGEIVGLGGLQGQGQREFLRCVMGLSGRTSGTVQIQGLDLKPRSPALAVAAGLGYVPHDRRNEGLAIRLSLRANVEAAWIQTLPWGLVRGTETLKRVGHALKQLAVKYRDPEQSAMELSGGNQQKLVLAKWLARQCRVLLLDEPTRGIDVGAKVEIYRTLRQLANEGLGVVIATSDLLELIGLSDRIIVIFEGQIVGQVDGARATEENVTAMAMGTTKEGTA